MLEEIWKDIENYNGFYEISNLGRCRTHYAKGSGKYTRETRLLTPVKCTNGYLEYQLSKNGVRKCHMAHRLVAQAFIPNPDNKPEVNHKDEVINNNVETNLEWVTSKENANYGTRNARATEKQSIKLVQLSLSGDIIAIHTGLNKAGATVGVDSSSIMRVCKGKQKTSKGFKWMYYNDYLNKTTLGEVI